MSKSFHNTTFFISISYLVIVSIFLVWHRSFFSPDQFFAAALLITLLIGRLKQFIRDWSTPVILFLGYDYLRGLAPKLSLEAHIHPMIYFDKAVFGNIPTIKLQNLLFSDGTIHWYDYLSVLLYMSHFIVPMVVGFIFWLKSKEYFKEYSLSLLILSYCAFITYIIFPAMPPWMASQLGFIPEIDKVMDKVFANFPNPINLPTVYKFIGANLVAAVPSLHAAYPVLTFLFIFRKYKRIGLLILPYVFGVWLSIVYLGEHYVFDILVGVMYSTTIFILVTNRNRLWKKARSLNLFRLSFEGR